MKKTVTIVFLATIFIMLFVPFAFAAEEAQANGAVSALALATGLCISIAAFGGALAQGLAMIESLVIYSLVISFMLLGKF